MAAIQKQTGMKVIIVGGSIAGLVLAHSLHHAGIDFVVLERRERVDPQVGASIGLFANGARILDQLGVYEDIQELIEPPSWLEVVTGEGQLVQKVDSPQLMHARMGYPISFLERQRILKILFDRLPDRTKIHVNKKVVSIDSLTDNVLVYCEDGSLYVGDVVAGADGVHSRIRREMWRHAEGSPTVDKLEKDKNAMSSEYRCLFGMSSAVPGLEGKTHYRAFNRHWSFLVVPGKGDRCFWFVFERLDKTYHTSEIPRYTETDKHDFVKPYMNRYVSQNVTFAALWTRKICSSLTALEEAQHNLWTFDRIVCLGDSIHKMTPNIGQGGNLAMESAAALANSLNILNQSCGRRHPSIDQIRSALTGYQRKRRPRSKEICDTANLTTRLEAISNYLFNMIVLYVVPYGGDFPVDVFCQLVLGATKLDFLPLPEKSRGVSFRPAQVTHQNIFLWRVIRALPLLSLSLVAYCFLDTSTSQASSLSIDRTVSTEHQTFLRQTISNSVHWINKHAFLQPISSSNYTERRHIISFMCDLVPLQIIWTIESFRRGSFLTVVALSSIFWIAAQWKGMGYVAPLYYFFHYIQAPVEKYAAADNRLVPTNYAKTLIAAIIFGYILPTGFVFLTISANGFQHAMAFWQLFPVWTAFMHRIFAFSVVDTTAHDRIYNPLADMPYLRRIYVFGAALSGIAYIYLFSTAWGDVGNTLRGIMHATTPFEHQLKYHHLVTFISGLIWQLLHFRDLKKSGKLDAAWFKIIGIFACTSLLFGPSASQIVYWAWREEVLARRLYDGIKS